MKNVVTIAGSDTLGGGGLQADLKTFEELDTFGVSVITCLASINKNEEFIIDNISLNLVKQQLDSIFIHMDFDTIKIGLVNDSATLKYLGNYFSRKSIKIINDPVLVFKESANELNVEYLKILKNDILPISTITTPNLKEAEIISGISIENKTDLQLAAKKIQNIGVPNVVIKGGTRFHGSQATDYALLNNKELWLDYPKLDVSSINGAGCTFSAAITAELAKYNSMENAVKLAKNFVYQGIKAGINLKNNTGNVWQGAYRNNGKEKFYEN